MTGLILKDFINLKKYIRIQLAIIVFYSVIFLPQGKIDFICAFFVFLGAFPVMSAIAFDDTSKWNSFATTMPIERKDLVLSKYLLMIIFLLCSGLLCFILLTVSSTLSNSLDINKTIFMTVLYFCLGIIYDSINMPIIFKLGSEKARLVMLLVLFIPVGLTFALSKVVSKTDITNLSNIFDRLANIIPILAIGITIVIALASYFISTNIFAKKEF